MRMKKLAMMHVSNVTFVVLHTIYERANLYRKRVVSYWVSYLVRPRAWSYPCMVWVNRVGRCLSMSLNAICIYWSVGIIICARTIVLLSQCLRSKMTS